MSPRSAPPPPPAPRALLALDDDAPLVPPPGDRLDALALAFVPGVGPVRYRDHARRFGGADAGLLGTTGPAARDAARALALAALDDAARAGASLLLLGDPAYPDALVELPDPPPALWTLGDPALLHRPRDTVAVVGTRRMTPYGERTTRALCTPLAAAGAVIVSGMALGIDGVAHAAALDAHGATVAVLGSGVDVPYPPAHRRLHERIVGAGLVVSEQRPGDRGTRGTFPRRNRVIAALAHATLVVEAGAASGALITAGVALDLGRTVAAVPGPVDSGAAAGCNRLIRDGAILVADADDALALVGRGPVRGAPAPPDGGPSAPPPGFSNDETAVWRALAGAPRDVDSLVLLTGLPARRCMAAVAMLEVAGAVDSAIDGRLRRRG